MTKDDATPLLEEIGEGSLWLGGNGQGNDYLNSCPIARKNAPTHKDRVDTAYICKYDGTEFYQWVGRKADGCFHPIGKIMRLTKAGKAINHRRKKC